MGIQAATTGNLESAQNILIAQCKFTAESNAPCVGLITSYKLAKGDKQMTVPKVGQMAAAALADGVDMIASEDIGLTTTDLTPSEVGLKVILTDKLVRQFNEDILKVVGKQMGDAIARYKDDAVIALFSALNGGTVLGADNKNLGLLNASACIANLRAKSAPEPIAFVHHPTAIGYLSTNAAGIGATYFMGVMQGFSEDRVRNFWKINIDGVNFFWDANIDKIAGYDSGYGAVFSKEAMCIIESLAPNVERERDASLRAWEINLVTDYGVFELDDQMGFPCQYEIGNLTTSN
jgi:hypothetical protein